MRQALSILVVVMVGCGASTPVVQYPGIKKDQRVEEKKLPDRPDAKPIPKDKDWVKALPAGATHIKDGILFSAEKAIRAKLWKAGYNALRRLYNLDRQIWVQHRIVYEERLGHANAEIKRISPSWWTENKGTIAWAAGFLMGAAATVAIVYAVQEVKK